MRIFAFEVKEKKDIIAEEDGWIFKMKYSHKVGFFHLKSPVIRKITYSKGETIRYIRHTVFGVGYIDNSMNFKGIAIFDFFERCLFVLLGLTCIGSTSESICSGILLIGLFYLLWVFLSWEDDDSNLHTVQRMCQMQSY